MHKQTAVHGAVRTWTTRMPLRRAYLLILGAPRTARQVQSRPPGSIILTSEDAQPHVYPRNLRRTPRPGAFAGPFPLLPGRRDS